MSERDIEIGETYTVVITEANKNEDRDPVTQINGKSTFVRFNEYQPDFGEEVTVRLADMTENYNIAVAID